MRGTPTPAAFSACEVRPEQSKLPGPDPPHWYGLPICARAQATAASPAAALLPLLPPGAGEPGQDARGLLGLDEEVIEFEINPDRAYALSLRGVARDAALAYDLPATAFHDPCLRDVPAADDAGHPVRVEDEVGCPVFVARTVAGIDPTAPTPTFMARRLALAGMRSVSVAVDVTNYVMLELGQPLHAFDADSVKGELVVRRAKEGEKLTTLDDVERTLDPEDIVICDETGVIWAARSLSIGRAAPEPTEQIEVRWVPFDEALAMTLDGRITDAMSVIGIQRVALERAGAAEASRTGRD